MTVDQVAELFKWMTIINVGIFLLSSLMTIVLKKFMRKMHGMIFGIDEGKVPIVLYGYLGTYRIFILVFNLVPYVSLLIMK